MAEQKAGRVLGVGGVFFRSKNPEGLARWYAEHLGLDVESWGGPRGANFLPSAMPKNSFTVWGAFPADTEYFGDRGQAFMLNLVVDDLDAALERVVAGGAERMPDTEDHDYGRFGWFTDPDGNRVELWEPPEDDDGDG
jgi:predicted enzyme related to lactoylglutathione lyase